MEIRKSSGLFACTLLLVLASLPGCGGSNNTTIPSVATIFYSHSLVFRNNSAMTTGYNGFGQLGDGTLNTRSNAAFVPGLGHLVGGAAGGEHTLVFGNNSSIMAWGYNLYGQLGSATVSTTGVAAYSSTPVKVPMHGIVSAVAAGGFHSLAIVNGTVYGWGYNSYGQVGDGTFVNQLVPVQVKNGQDGTPLGSPQLPATQVAAGGSHSLALLSDGSVWAWGYNANGQLGIDPTSINGLYSQVPRRVSQLDAVTTFNNGPLSHIEQIAVGGTTGSYSLALENDRDVSGNIIGQTLWGWGYNGMGQLGQDPVSVPYSFQPVKLFTLSGTVDDSTILIKKVSGGLDHVLLLLGSRGSTSATGKWTVSALGFNGLGQLGNNTIINSFTLVQALGPGTATPNPVLSGVTDIAAFGNSSLAKVGSGLGTWYGWGDNGSGQIGNPISTTSLGYLLIPAVVQGYLP